MVDGIEKYNYVGNLPANINNAVIRVNNEKGKYNCHGFTGIVFGMSGIDIENYANGHRNLSIKPEVGTLFAIHDSFAKTVVHSGVVVGFDENNEPLVISKEGKGGDVTIKTANNLLAQYSKYCIDDLRSWIESGMTFLEQSTKTKMFFVLAPKI